MCNSKDKYIQEITIKTADELYDYIHGKKDVVDLRSSFIFRGVSSESYDLTPSIFRKGADKEISCFINEEDCSKNVTIYTELDIVDYDNYSNPFDKDKIHKKELGILIKFYDFADKSGLEVPEDHIPRNFLHSEYNESQGNWPTISFFEVISLAQHYGLPTRALDWSYDYKVSLYFSVKDILEDKPSKNGALWAFNYKYFENNDISIPDSKRFPLKIYRPQYAINPNLRSQKGVFTIHQNFTRNDNSYSSYSVDEIIIEQLENNVNNGKYTINGLKPFKLEENEKIFYKFIIPKDIKKDLLNDLYLEDYSEEYIYPGYKGVVKAMKNRITLNNLLNE